MGRLKLKTWHWIGIAIAVLFLFKPDILDGFMGTVYGPEGFILIGDSNLDVTGITLVGEICCCDPQRCLGVYDSKYWEGPIMDPSHTAASHPTDFHMIGAHMKDYGSVAGFITLKKNIRHMNFKIDAVSYSELGVNLNNFEVWLVDENDNVITKLPIWNLARDSTCTFEMTPSVLNPDDVQISWCGSVVQNINLAGQDVVYFSYWHRDSVHLNSQPVEDARYKLLFSCQMGPNEMLAYEMFLAGSTISQFSTQHEIQKLCLDNPAVIYDQIEGGTTTTAEIYQIMIEGGTYNVPPNQIVGIFYVLNAQAAGITVPCSEGAFNVETGECTDIGGLVTICTTGLWDSLLGTCALTIYDFEILCPYGGVYDSTQNKCIYRPPIQYICEYGDYHVLLGYCAYEPATPGDCSGNYAWNEITGYCEGLPASQIICPPYYGYDAVRDKCIRNVESEEFCIYPDSIYDATESICMVDIPETPICPEGAYLTPDFSRCIYDATTDHQCLQGGMYNEELDKCIILPDYDYLCLQGEMVVLPSNEIVCQIETGIFVCPEDFYWSEKRQACIQQGDVITTGTCETDADCAWECASEEVIDGTCDNNICFIDTADCPEVKELWWAKFKQWLIDNMLFIMLFLMAVNIFLIVVQRGRLTGKQIEMYGRRNRQGVVYGVLGGAIFGLLILSLYPISWVMLWTILSGGFLGVIVDHLYKPKK